MPIPGPTLDTLDQFAGKELGVSEWVTVGQHRIDGFADATGDHQWIHVDRERAAKESSAVEIEGEDKPAVVADLLSLMLPDPERAAAGTPIKATPENA